MPFFNPRTYLTVSHTLLEGSEAFKAELKKQVAAYLTELGKPFLEEEFTAAISCIQNYRFKLAGLVFTYYRQ